MNNNKHPKVTASSPTSLTYAAMLTNAASSGAAMSSIFSCPSPQHNHIKSDIIGNNGSPRRLQIQQ